MFYRVIKHNFQPIRSRVISYLFYNNYYYYYKFLTISKSLRERIIFEQNIRSISLYFYSCLDDLSQLEYLKVSRRLFTRCVTKIPWGLHAVTNYLDSCRSLNLLIGRSAQKLFFLAGTC